jgi:hypothetical protein
MAGSVDRLLKRRITMSRTIEISLPPDQTETAVAAFREIEGVIGLQVQLGSSRVPAGDVISLSATNQALHRIMERVQKLGLRERDDVVIRTSEPLMLVRKEQNPSIFRSSLESSWEEIESMIAKESNMTINGLLLMATAGFIAGIGVTTEAIHLVIGAMAIAPGFLPIVRIVNGFVARIHSWRSGLQDLALGYFTLVAAAAAASLLIQLVGKGSLGDGSSTYLRDGSLIDFWTTITPEGIAVSAAAALAGAILLVCNRSVLTAGVMIALALIPTAALVGVGAAAGEWSVAGMGLLRWLIDVAIVALAALIILQWKKSSVLRRPGVL